MNTAQAQAIHEAVLNLHSALHEVDEGAAETFAELFGMLDGDSDDAQHVASWAIEKLNAAGEG